MKKYPAQIKTSGFSLIELMIVVAIIGIIAAVGYPSYTQYILKSGRSEGAAALLQLMERQEHHYRDQLVYTDDLTDLGYSTTSIESETGRYSLGASECAAGTSLKRCVLLTATPQNEQSDDPAGPITLNSRGIKSASWPE